MKMVNPTIAIINLTFGDGLDHPFMFKGQFTGKPHDLHGKIDGFKK
jgi:hypothetical protein